MVAVIDRVPARRSPLDIRLIGRVAVILIVAAMGAAALNTAPGWEGVGPSVEMAQR